MSFRFHTSFVFALILAVLNPLRAQTPATSLVGHVESNKYVSPTGAFRVTIPVIAELGGSITDTDNVVTFQDDFNTHESIACFKMDATQRWEEETRGRKDYLIWFFSNFVQADFQQRFPGARIESAHFIPSVQSGALLTYNLLPGGSMFAFKSIVVDNSEPPMAKRGNLVFAHNGFVYVISIELAEKVLERSAYNKTVTEEDQLLRQRLIDLHNKITFSTPLSQPDLPEKAPALTPPNNPPGK
jgi:hypothetical protein